MRSVAVIGAGVSGLTAAYLLRHEWDVTLFEAETRLGGHAHTHDLPDGGSTVAVDSGFIVHNDRTYPLLRRLFAELGVPTRATEMSMSVRCDGCGLEYAGAKGPSGLFARRPTGAHLAMLAQVPLFHRRARALLATADNPTLGEFLARGRFSAHFVRHFVVPLVSAVWSCGPEVVADYPARYLFTFLSHHGMLSVTGSPTWRTVTGGSRTYVDLLAKHLPRVRAGDPVTAVSRTREGVVVDGSRFDAVVVATHADQALRLLTDATEAERRVLGAFGYSRNETVLHTDATILPVREKARASWNYRLPGCAPSAGPPVVTYDMNRLQGLDARRHYLVTLNSDRDGLARMTYEHPIYTPASVAAQAGLPGLNDGRTAFAGAYHGWGFHEDGCRSGVEAARSLGVVW
ncbi:FAD-dependent oxidoreductase [Actinoplanes bogorensis]|uniref:FAD-dependent oxidoreductase n=1 Tax=Paractinoplanes bogorensis TaxID=1610840 RepID=A0ABS5YLT6_9ACTN|nr:FAD-dependent oxidoreductase [Actinoplanes bogorensis]MBU2664276.1 FAD-dependent oxidoreductase [Actinoplanes bogorensis]